jgi:hypothetical protein
MSACLGDSLHTAVGSGSPCPSPVGILSFGAGAGAAFLGALASASSGLLGAAAAADPLLSWAFSGLAAAVLPSLDADAVVLSLVSASDLGVPTENVELAA